MGGWGRFDPFFRQIDECPLFAHCRRPLRRPGTSEFPLAKIQTGILPAFFFPSAIVHAMFPFSAPLERGAHGEAGMGQMLPSAAKKRITVFDRAARRKRILARLEEGSAYGEIAREEGVTPRWARQIIAEVLREVDDHTLLKLALLRVAPRTAREATTYRRRQGDRATDQGDRQARPAPHVRRSRTSGAAQGAASRRDKTRLRSARRRRIDRK